MNSKGTDRIKKKLGGALHMLTMLYTAFWYDVIATLNGLVHVNLFTIMCS
jgi:hypothetical protein